MLLGAEEIDVKTLDRVVNAMDESFGIPQALIIIIINITIIIITITVVIIISIIIVIVVHSVARHVGDAHRLFATLVREFYLGCCILLRG